MIFNMDDLAAKVRARRGADCIDATGASRASPEVAEWHNDLHRMKAEAATREEIRAALEPRRIALRAAGHNI